MFCFSREQLLTGKVDPRAQASIGVRAPRQIVDNPELCAACFGPFRIDMENWITLDPRISRPNMYKDDNTGEDEVAYGLSLTPTVLGMCGHRVHEHCLAKHVNRQRYPQSIDQIDWDANNKWTCYVTGCKTKLSSVDREQIEARINAGNVGDDNETSDEKDAFVDVLAAIRSAAAATPLAPEAPPPQSPPPPPPGITPERERDLLRMVEVATQGRAEAENALQSERREREQVEARAQETSEALIVVEARVTELRVRETAMTDRLAESQARVDTLSLELQAKRDEATALERDSAAAMASLATAAEQEAGKLRRELLNYPLAQAKRNVQRNLVGYPRDEKNALCIRIQGVWESLPDEKKTEQDLGRALNQHAYQLDQGLDAGCSEMANQLYLSRCAWVWEPLESGMLPMILAAKSGNVGGVLRLYNLGANLDSPDPSIKRTPLMAAAENGRGDVVLLLLEMRVFADVPHMKKGRTALSFAEQWWKKNKTKGEQKPEWIIALHEATTGKNMPEPPPEPPPEPAPAPAPEEQEEEEEEEVEEVEGDDKELPAADFVINTILPELIRQHSNAAQNIDALMKNIENSYDLALRVRDARSKAFRMLSTPNVLLPTDVISFDVFRDKVGNEFNDSLTNIQIVVSPPLEIQSTEFKRLHMFLKETKTIVENKTAASLESDKMFKAVYGYRLSALISLAGMYTLEVPGALQRQLNIAKGGNIESPNDADQVLYDAARQNFKIIDIGTKLSRIDRPDSNSAKSLLDAILKAFTHSFSLVFNDETNHTEFDFAEGTLSPIPVLEFLQEHISELDTQIADTEKEATRTNDLIAKFESRVEQERDSMKMGLLLVQKKKAQDRYDGLQQQVISVMSRDKKNFAMYQKYVWVVVDAVRLITFGIEDDFLQWYNARGATLIRLSIYDNTEGVVDPTLAETVRGNDITSMKQKWEDIGTLSRNGPVSTSYEQWRDSVLQTFKSMVTVETGQWSAHGAAASPAGLIEAYTSFENHLQERAKAQEDNTLKELLIKDAKSFRVMITFAKAILRVLDRGFVIPAPPPP